MKKIILAITFFISLYSCGNFLGPSSPNDYIPETVEALDEVLIGDVYPNSLSATKTLFEFNEIFSDNVGIFADKDAFFTEDEITKLIQTKRIFGMDPDMLDPDVLNGAAVSNTTWESHFEKIMACNTIFDYIGSVKGRDEIRNRVLAEAHFFRAFYYFNFINIYGKPYNEAPDSPGVPIKLTSKFNPNLMPRNTVREVYEQIVKDLNDAESYYAKFNNDYYISPYKPSAVLLYAFRSRVALYMEDWESSKEYAQKVFKSQHRFTIYDLNGFAPTSLTPYLSYTNIENVNSETIYAYSNPNSTLGIIDPYMTIPKNTGINQSNEKLTVRLLIASDDLMNRYKDGDLRKENYVVTFLSSNTNKKIPGYYLPYGKININSQNTPAGNSKDFGLCFRLSEIYLNYAESCAKLGGANTAAAIEKMSELLSKRYIVGSPNAAVPALTGNELVDYIREERRKELCFEGHRWFDQRRCGMKAFDKEWYENGILANVIKITEKDAAFTMKLSKVVLLNNSRLVQNDEWSKKY